MKYLILSAIVYIIYTRFIRARAKPHSNIVDDKESKVGEYIEYEEVQESDTTDQSL